MTIFLSPNSLCRKQEEKFSTLAEKFSVRSKKCESSKEYKHRCRLYSISFMFASKALLNHQKAFDC